MRRPDTGELSDGTIIDLPPADDMIPKSPHSYDSHITAMNGGQMNGYDLLGPDCEGPAYRCHQAYEPEQIPTSPRWPASSPSPTIPSRPTDRLVRHALTIAASWLDGFYTATHHTPDGVQDGPGLGCDSNQVGSGTRTTRRSPGPSPRASRTWTGPGLRALARPLGPLDHGAPGQQGHSWRIYGAPFAANGNGYGWSTARASRTACTTRRRSSTSSDGTSCSPTRRLGNLPDFSFVIPDNDPRSTNRGR